MAPRPVTRPQPSKGKEKEKDSSGDDVGTRELSPAMRKLKDQLAELYVTMGVMFITPIDQLGGQLVVRRSNDLAEEWAKLADSDPQVKKVLQRIVSAGGWGSILIGHATIAMAVLVNRGLGPDPLANAIAITHIAQDPDVAPFFNHSRFQETPAPSGANGNSGS